MHYIATDDESNRDNMVGEHLDMILATSLGIEHDELMDPAGQLAQVVEFNRAGKEANRIVDPEVFRLKGKAGKIDVYALKKMKFSTCLKILV